jgi:uncharacterized protein YcfJ
MRKGLTAIIASLALAGSLVIAGCSGQPLSTREEGTLGGAGIGAVGGTLVGAAVGHPLAGAAIGGVLGGGTGYVVGNSLQNTQNANAQTQAQVQSQQQEIENQRQQIQQLRSQGETE